MHKLAIERIVSGINSEEVRLKAKYPFLYRQDFIGFTIMLFALCGMIGSAFLYSIDIIPAWLCIILAGFFASISHELEHDLIHKLYFRNNAFMHNLMMSIVWLMRPNTVNPWYRRKIHLLHHKSSGTQQDLEERLVGNGITNIFVRCIVMFDGLLGLLLQRKVLKSEVKVFNFLTVFNAGFPLATCYFISGYLFIIYHSISYLLPTSVIYPQWILSSVEWLNFLMVVIIAPNFVRSACLNVVTSYMHYYGNVNNLLQQTQVIKGWFVWPLNLFCFNFSQTHSIHHFVIQQPFYLRQMVTVVAHKLMKENGVRFNDFSTFNKGNRFKD